MSTQPVTNPGQVSPALLGQEEYQAMAAGFAAQNANIIAKAQPGEAVTISYVSLAAVQAVESASAAGTPATAAQIAAQMTPYTFIPVPAVVTPPMYSLGAPIGGGAYVLDTRAGYPTFGVPIQINGQWWTPEPLGMFDVAVTPTPLNQIPATQGAVGLGGFPLATGNSSISAGNSLTQGPQ